MPGMILLAPDRGTLCRRLARQLARVVDDPRYDKLTMLAKIDLSVSRAERPTRTDSRLVCFTCRVNAAGGGRGGPYSAYCPADQAVPR